MMNAVAEATQAANSALFAKIGENVRNSEGGVEAVISAYESAVKENKSIFPDEVTVLYREVKKSGENASNELVGEFALKVETYAPRAAIMGDIVGKTFGAETQAELAGAETQSTEAELTSAETETEAELATDTNVGDSVFHSPADRDIAEPIDLFDNYKGSDGQIHAKTSRHKHIENVVAKTEAKLIWSTNVTRGQYIPSSKTILMNPELDTSEQYNFIFKHEFTHYLEDKKGYTDFKDYVFEESSLFEDWARTQLEEADISAEGSREEIIKQITELYYDTYRNSPELSEYMRRKFTMSNAEEEVLADFVGDNLLGTQDKLEETLAMLSGLKRKKPSVFEKIRNFFKEMLNRIRGVRGFKSLEEDFEYLNGRLQELVAAPDVESTAAEGDVKYSIVALENGNTYVKASRNIISGNNISEWRKQITTFFNELLDGGKSLNINTIDGDVLTITKSETANKARDNYQTINGQRRIMTDNEFRVKLNAEAHIDEIAETSIGSQNKKADTKSHSFAKDGFTYRTAYFQDFDGTYYRLKLSIGNNGTVATVYNVGKINKDSLPSHTKIVGVVGSKPLGKLSDNSIPNSAENVKTDVLYVESDKNRTNAWEKRTGLQLPVGSSDISSSDNNISQSDTVVKNNISENEKKYSETDSEIAAKLSIPVTRTAKLLDKLENGEITREEFNREINRNVSEEAKRVFAKAEAKWEADRATAVEKHKAEVERIREEALRAERKEREMRKDRESNIYAIRRSVKRLNNALMSNSKAKHIPESLKGAVTEFCRVFYENDKATFDRRVLADIASYYRQFSQEKTDIMKCDPAVSELLDELIKWLPGKKLTELNKYELEIVRTLTDSMNNSVKSEETVFLNEKRTKLEEAGNSALKEISAVKPNMLSRLLNANDKISHAKGYFFEGNLKPEYFFKRLGPTFKKCLDGLYKGQGKFGRNMLTAQSFIEKTKNKYSYDTWKRDTVTLETESGEKHLITVEQAMALVATAEREKSNERQASEHLSLGGVVFDNGKQLKVISKALKKVEKAEKSGKSKDIDSAKGALNAEIEKLKSKPIQLTFTDIGKLNRQLTPDQKGYMREFVKFLSTDCAAWGNEVTMEQYGYRQYTEDNYFPYVSAEQFLYTDPSASDNNALRHASFTNSLQKNANNPLVISSFTDVAISHTEQMASYNAMTVPVEALNKLFNYKTEAKPGVPSRAVRMEIESKFGKGAVEYIENFIRDVNNGVRGDSRDSFVNSLNSKFKKTAVLGNISVVVQQPFAIIRACADMDVKYMLKASKYHSKDNYEEMKEFAPVAIIKQMGSFDTGVGVKNATWLSGESTFMNKLDDALGIGAEKADEIAWSYLWSATKAEIAGTTDLKPGTVEFLEAAGERVSDLINKTQVYDSVLSKSQNMRNKGLGGTLTSFMAEPTTEINMLYDAFSDLAQGKISVKQAARVTTVLINSALLTAIAQGFAYAMRDDDEDKSFTEKWAYQSAGSFVDNLNPLSKIPYIRDIFSVWDGYDVERQDFSLVSDVVSAVKSLTTGEPSYYKVRKLAEAVANLYGVPVKNVLRDIEATVRTFLAMFDDNTPTAEGIKESILEGVSENDIIAIFTGKKS